MPHYALTVAARCGTCAVQILTVFAVSRNRELPRMGHLAKVFAVTLLALAIAACGGGDDDAPEPEDTATAESTTASEDPTATATTAPEGPPGISQLAQGVVQIVALNQDGNTVWHGSGTVIDEKGLILTNAHVVDNRGNDYSRLGIAVTDRTDQPPVPSFIAEVVAIDYVIDLAVLRVVSDLDGGIANFSAPAVKLGDSDQVELGDDLQILGFPGIGGETITLTQGTVSGFNAQNSIANRAWIKTDATISGGNSGGLAANAAGEIIGIPTIAGSTEDVSPVDCRLIVDTNRDGVVNEADTCVPIGGFINGLRPIALALPLIEAAENEEKYVSAYGEIPTAPPPDSGVDTSQIDFSRLFFTNGVTDENLPKTRVHALPSGATHACAFWDYGSMTDGLSWEALWFVNGEVSSEGSMINQTWFGGPEGTWWVCTFDLNGLSDGLYELALNVEGDLITTDSLYVGGGHPAVDVTIINESARQICYVQISPSEAINWGPDELGSEDTIAPDSSQTIKIAAGTVDLRLLDCDEEILITEYELDASDGGSYTLE
jgi:serine protease Do